MKPSFAKAAAFTLIELIVVLAIISALTVLIVPTYQRTVQQSRAAACLSNLRQLGVALNLYLGEHNMKLPILQGARRNKSEDTLAIDNTLNAYTQDQRIFACPADIRGLAMTTGTSYFWNSALNGQSILALTFFLTDQQSHIPVMFDKESFHPYEPSKVNFLYADGHATKDSHDIFTTSK